MDDVRIIPDRVILGIDPGTTMMGYAVIRIVHPKPPELIVMGGIDLRKVKDVYLKLKQISEQVQTIVDTYLPDEMALEAPFFGKNIQSMLKLGRAQGVAMAAALRRDIPVSEYAPRKVKMMVVGQGEASKEQIARMLQAQFHIQEMPKMLDATDALAVALCHYYCTTSVLKKINEARNHADADRKTSGVVKRKKNTSSSTKRASSWEQFALQNPQKIVGKEK